MDWNFFDISDITILLSVNGTLNEGLFHLSSSCVGIFPIASFFLVLIFALISVQLFMMVPLLYVPLYLYVWGITKMEISSEYTYTDSENAINCCDSRKF